jgi:DNA-binding NtrC family response regulator
VKEQLDALVMRMYKGGILYREGLREFKKTFVTTAIREQKGNLAKAATALRLHRNTLTRITSRLEIDVGALRPSARRPPESIRPGYVRKIGSR